MLPAMKKRSTPLQTLLSEIGIERVFLPVLTGIHQPAMDQHYPNNSTLSKQTCMTCKTLKETAFSKSLLCSERASMCAQTLNVSLDPKSIDLEYLAHLSKRNISTDVTVSEVTVRSSAILQPFLIIKPSVSDLLRAAHATFVSF